jgi:hypothetical protein
MNAHISGGKKEKDPNLIITWSSDWFILNNQ